MAILKGFGNPQGAICRMSGRRVLTRKVDSDGTTIEEKWGFANPEQPLSSVGNVSVSASGQTEDLLVFLLPCGGYLL
jgi:hypothetical protein